MMHWLVSALLFTSFQVAHTETVRYVPHYTFKENHWLTEISLKNEQVLAQIVHLEAFDSSGQLLVSKELRLEPQGSLQGSLQTLIPELGDSTGWLSLRTANATISGHLSFKHRGGGGITSLPFTEKGTRHLALTGMVQEAGWRSGFAVANPNDEPVQIALQLIDGKGVVRHQAGRALVARGKLVTMVDELFPGELPDRFTIRVFAEAPITGLALNFEQDLKQIVAVGGDHLPGGPLELVDDLSDVLGVWESVGYGERWEITPSGVNQFFYSTGSCYPVRSVSLEDMGPILTLESQGLLAEFDATDTGPKYYRRLEGLPESCRNGGLTEDPIYNFESFWHTFNDQYAFFERHGVDWDAAYATYRPMVTAETSPEALKDIFFAMLAPFRDGHISMETPFGDYSGPLRNGTTPDRLDAEFAQSGSDDYGDWISGEINTLHQIVASKLQGPVINEFGRLFHGFLKEDIGYINFMLMVGFVDENNPNIDVDQVLAEASTAIGAIMDRFSQSKALVIDVRTNPGGADLYSLFLAGFLTDERLLACYKQARDGAGLTAPNSLWVEPNPTTRFTKPIVLLTSPFTASAAEIFTLALGNMPHVTILGEPGSGAFSDVLPKVLPNGWTFSLSNEVYFQTNDENYEALGAPVDVAVTTWLQEDRLNGQDSVLDAAIALIEQMD